MTTPCIGCGFELDELGNLQIKGARSREWSYNGSTDEFPVKDIDVHNGLSCDPVTEDLWAYPNASARFATGTAPLIGATGGPLTGFIFTWSLDKDDFIGANPFNDGTCPETGFALSDDASIQLENPSGSRPMIVTYSIDWGPMASLLDEGVSFYTNFQARIWDAGDPVPGFVNYGFQVNFLGSNDTADPLDFMQIGQQHIPVYRPGGGGVLANYLAPLGCTFFEARLRASMICNTATTRDGQQLTIGGGFNIRIMGVPV